MDDSSRRRLKAKFAALAVLCLLTAATIIVLWIRGLVSAKNSIMIGGLMASAVLLFFDGVTWIALSKRLGRTDE